MSHDYHQSLPGYHADQLLIDGCGECEHRAKDIERAISNLDYKRFVRAWTRAADQMASTPPSGDRGGPRSQAEAPMLHALWAIQVHLENRGIPLGTVPGQSVEASLGIVKAAREYIADRFHHPEQAERLTEPDIIAYMDRHYAGGWEAFCLETAVAGS